MTNVSTSQRSNSIKIIQTKHTFCSDLFKKKMNRETNMPSLFFTFYIFASIDKENYYYTDSFIIPRIEHFKFTTDNKIMSPYNKRTLDLGSSSFGSYKGIR